MRSARLQVRKGFFYLSSDVGIASVIDMGVGRYSFIFDTCEPHDEYVALLSGGAGVFCRESQDVPRDISEITVETIDIDGNLVDGEVNLYLPDTGNWTDRKDRNTMPHEECSLWRQKAYAVETMDNTVQVIYPSYNFVGTYGEWAQIHQIDDMETCIEIWPVHSPFRRQYRGLWRIQGDAIVVDDSENN